MLTLFHAPQTRSSRIIWLLEEIGAPYEIRPVSIFRPMTGEGSGDAANPHPDKKVPAIRHNDTIVAESTAIILYLLETFPEAGLAPPPGDPRRGDYLTWVAWYAAEMEPALLAKMGNELDGSPFKQRLYDTVVGRMRAALARGPYMMGDAFSAADLLISSALVFGRHAFPADEGFDAYIARCNARPAAIRGQALDAQSGLQAAA